MKRKPKRSSGGLTKIVLFAILLSGIYAVCASAVPAGRSDTRGIVGVAAATPGDYDAGVQASDGNAAITADAGGAGSERNAGRPPNPGESKEENGTAKPANAQGLKNVPEFTVPLRIDEIRDTRHLELVNREHPISGEPASGAIVSAWPGVAVSTTEITLHETALDALRELFAAARVEGSRVLFVSSGYRDFEKQKQIYDETADKAYVSLPNHSEHQTGLAVDIMVLDVSQWEMGASHEGRWLAENSWKYGFILRYAGDKQPITGTADEPWHFRYIGQPHAYWCWQNNLCFEEYVEFLREAGGYSVSLGGINYTVLRQMPQGDTIYVPEHLDYDVSSDNAGGYIVTAWE